MPLGRKTEKGKTKGARTVLGLILVITAVLHGMNISWGLPVRDRVYCYNGDEQTYLIRLNNLNPAEGDFDPDYYWKPHLNVYFTGAVLKTGQWMGLYDIGDREYYKKNPLEFRRVILWQRICWGKIPLLLLVLTAFMTGKIIKNEKFGLVFAGITGLLPTFLVNANYGVENVVMPLLTALVLLFCLRYHRGGSLRDLILAGILCGLAVSIKQSGLINFIFVLGAAWSVREKTSAARLCGDLAAAGIFACLAFALTSPFYMKFVLLKIFSPDRIQPDLHGSTSLPLDMFRWSWRSLPYTFGRIGKTIFSQLGGALLLWVPCGIFFGAKKYWVRWTSFYVIVFLGISLFSRYATDSRLTPLAYVLSLLGAWGLVSFFEKPVPRRLKRGAAVLTFMSLVLFTAAVEIFFLKPGTIEMSSRWIEKNVLRRSGVRIGLHEAPGHAHPDILTREWRHSTPGNRHYYKDEYNEVFVIPDYELRSLGVPDVLPARKLPNRTRKQQWLESRRPEFIILAHDLYDWPQYFNRSSSYMLVKLFSGYNLFGVGKLALVNPDVFIFKRRDSGWDKQTGGP